MQVDNGVEVTVKCRIGIDDQEPSTVLPAFLEMVADTGVRRVIIHARKAWLNGLSPKENRDVPPLDYPLVVAMKQAFPGLNISINGGITSVDQAKTFLGQGLDGVMIGRAAYHEPIEALAHVDAEIFGAGATVDAFAVVDAMRPYIARHLEGGGRLHQVTRHMLGLFHGRPGARGWRRILSEEANLDGAGLGVLDAALGPVREMA
jgi:tRNA-dihydrouridine synthase A